ncbi:MAG TPA: hypothetical protein VNX23_24780 [Bradyrhizobium sp.]|uniref:hypothetical protein n=1 Tax=Bradyrhizobium sp. TaxID=376 RepID=UPI002C5E76FF|nr:hypothetical protein [Bradyrhizobium sp.]HXB80582.1 hypothetical protein [Bradyrhizobium sp.]
MLTGFGASLAALFSSALRAIADAAGVARAAVDDFDFAAIFLGLATALAMTENDPLGDEEMGALHHFERPGASCESRLKG